MIVRWLCVAVCGISIGVLGCGSGQNAATSSGPIPNFTSGNWQIQSGDSAFRDESSKQDVPVVLLGGMSFNGSTASGTFSAYINLRTFYCPAPGAPLQGARFTGTVDSSGRITMQSGLILGSPMILTLQASQQGGITTATGSVEIKDGPCKLAPVPVFATSVASMTGKFAGDLADGFPDQPPAHHVVVEIQQGLSQDEYGHYPLKATISVAGSRCTATTTYTGITDGVSLRPLGFGPPGPPMIMQGTISTDGLRFSPAGVAIDISLCNRLFGLSGVLVRQ